MKIISLNLLYFILASYFSHAAEITYNDKSATILKTENVISVLVNREPEISVYVVGSSVNCRIFTATIDEAFSIQSKLAADSRSWIQCYGEYKSYENPSRINVETDRYSLGQKLSEE